MDKIYSPGFLPSVAKASSLSSLPLNQSLSNGKAQDNSKITLAQKQLLQLKLQMNRESNQKVVKSQLEEKKQQLDEEKSKALFLRKLLTFWDFNSLKKIRLLNKRLEAEATRELLKRDFYVRIPKGFDEFSAVEQKEYLKSIEVFIDHYNPKFQNVTIRKYDDIERLRLLKILGEYVRGLKFNFDHFDQLNKELMILEDFPRLNSLTHLHPLKQYYILRPPYPISLLKTFVSWDKKVTISPLFYQPTDYLKQEFLSIYELFAEETCKIRVKSMVISLHWTYEEHSKLLDQITHQLNRILWNNKDSLEELIIFSPLGKLKGLEIPILPNVKKLVSHVFFYKDPVLSLSPYHFGLLFPVDFRFQEQLPSLSHVELKLRDLWPVEFGLPFGLWSFSFELAGIAPQVKIVDVYDGDYGLKLNLRKTFPNAQIN